MAAGSWISEHVSEMWSKTGARWRGEAADAFYSQYITQMQECAERFDAACVTMEETTRALSHELAAIERGLSD